MCMRMRSRLCVRNVSWEWQKSYQFSKWCCSCVRFFFSERKMETCTYDNSWRNKYMCRHKKIRTLWLSGLWFFRCACAVPYLGYRHAFFCLKLPRCLCYMRRLAWAFAGRLCDKDAFFMCWLKSRRTDTRCFDVCALLGFLEFEDHIFLYTGYI